MTKTTQIWRKIFLIFWKKLLTNVICYDILYKHSARPLGQAAKTSPSHGENGSSILPGVTIVAYYKIWPVGQAVKTRPFHGCNMGSIPVRVTKNHLIQTRIGWFFFWWLVRGISPGDVVAGFAYPNRRSASSLARRRARVYSASLKFPN